MGNLAWFAGLCGALDAWDDLMRRSTLAVVAGTTLIATVAVAAGTAIAAAETSRAPEPAKLVEVARLFTGRWFEIARTPMKLTDGCVAGTTDFGRDDSGRLMDHDACRKGTPEGAEKSFGGPVTLLDPSTNAKFRVDYKVFGVFTAPRTWWVLDRGDDYGWFIISDPSFKTVSLFTRDPRPSKAQVGELTARAQSLGYDVGKLEYPARFPPGEGHPTAP
jgi:apolipoprotein D and lipocalin family protein